MQPGAGAILDCLAPARGDFSRIAQVIAMVDGFPKIYNVWRDRMVYPAYIPTNYFSSPIWRVRWVGCTP